MRDGAQRARICSHVSTLRSVCNVTGVLAIVVGVALIAWGLYKLFGDGDYGRRRSATLIGGVIAIGLGVQQLRHKY